ncbi:MAG: ATP-grasp domain-containing protein [Acidobacteria bacterium]|nr:ATP-grasp domain-containing protein [Acidobacteriota bacterium]
MAPRPKRILLLASKLGYQTKSFAEAAHRLQCEVVFASDRCEKLADPWQDGAISVHFEKPSEAAAQIEAGMRQNPVDALIALGDRPTIAGAITAEKLGLKANSRESVEGCRTKLRQREILRDAGLPVPEFFSFRLKDDLRTVNHLAVLPCVVKPLVLSGSQGVIRANTPEEFVGAVWRIKALLESPEIQATRESGLDRLLVERFIPGREVALEGLLTAGKLRVLAIFDKPDPLDGPYFEETIYVTPSRLPVKTQEEIEACAEKCVQALGLTHGPVHAEFRINDAGVWVLEVAPRPIGGMCARALRFGPEEIFLEELLVRHSLGMPGTDWPRESLASGVMMIPVPQSGIYEGVNGLDAAKKVEGVDEIMITAREKDYLAAWPEGSSYLGFIFARADKPEVAETALRAAHSQLKFTMTPRLPVEHPATGKIR